MPILIQNIYVLCKEDCSYKKGTLLRVEKIEGRSYFKVFHMTGDIYPNGIYEGQIEENALSTYIENKIFIQGNLQSLKKTIALL